MIRPRILHCAIAILSTSWIALCGCGGGKNFIGTTTPPATAAFHGRVMSGTQPVVGASVQMYAASLTGYGSAAAPLLASSVTTDATGNFTINEGAYTCASSSTQIYFVVSEGTVGSSYVNTAIALMNAWGNCGDLNNSTTVFVNEATTVAAAWALAPFMASVRNMGASATNTVGLANAIALAHELADPTTGVIASAALSNGRTTESAKLGSLANILATCARATASTACNSLFSLTTGTAESTPTNLIDAALRIAKNPGRNVLALFQSASSTPYQGRTTAPADWTLSISSSGGGLAEPTAVAIDSNGRAWSGNYGGGVSAFTPTGVAVFATGLTGGGVAQVYGVTVDPSDNVWATNQSANSVTKFSKDGAVLSGAAGYKGGGISRPNAAASDTGGSIWITNYSSTASNLSNDGTPANSNGYDGSGTLGFPVAVALGSDRTPWIANQTGSVSHLSTTGALLQLVNCCSSPGGIAIDNAGNVWVADYLTSSVKRITSGAVASTSTGGGISFPNGIAVDGAGKVWTANYRGNTLSLLAGASSTNPSVVLTPASGFGADAGMNLPFGIAIDASGGVWVSSSGNDRVVHFIGLATPVKTPLLGPPQLP